MPIPTVDFSEALKELVNGTQMRRMGWEADDMRVMYVKGPFQHLVVRFNAGRYKIWLPDQADLFAHDWYPYR